MLKEIIGGFLLTFGIHIVIITLAMIATLIELGVKDVYRRKQANKSRNKSSS